MGVEELINVSKQIDSNRDVEMAFSTLSLSQQENTKTNEQAPLTSISSLKHRFWRVFKFMKPIRFNDPKVEKQFTWWKHPAFLANFRVNALLDLVTYIVDPFFNEISFCNSNRTTSSPSLCPDTALGPFLKLFRLTYFPAVILFFLILSVIPNTPAVHQVGVVINIIAVGWATVYIFARIADFGAQQGTADSTTAVFTTMLFCKLISFGCGSRMTLVYIGVGFGLLLTSEIPIFKIVAPHSGLGALMYHLLGGIMAAAMVLVNMRGGEEMERRLFALLNLFESDVCQKKFDEKQ
ncbi:hypothetical protein HDU97_003675 [Phlyctochytrium planicorne]|nr:hypothetical protein HDU97_003675 [Phlyctochytrium planicorne]